MASLLSKYLKALGVPHTDSYADSCFQTMAFRTLFGMQRVLERFGVESRGLKFSCKENITYLPLPFIAQLHSGIVIVDSISREGDDRVVNYDTIHGKNKSVLADFINSFTGVVLESQKQPGAKEPDLAEHRFQDFANGIKMPLLVVLLTLLSVYGSVVAGLWDSIWKIAVMLLDVAGIAVCYLLWLKTNGVKSKIADSMCGLTTEHGCDKVLDTRSASFMGIFKWSEVGMGYFAVSLMALLIYPQSWSTLALFNACCLPYTVWSVCEQKFVIKSWCTLCLTVQTLLWCLFACYMAGGAWHMLSVNIETFVLLACYVCAVLLMNLINIFISKAKKSSQILKNQN